MDTKFVNLAMLSGHQKIYHNIVLIDYSLSIGTETMQDCEKSEAEINR